jgi:hypothetical protein
MEATERRGASRARASNGVCSELLISVEYFLFGIGGEMRGVSAGLRVSSRSLLGKPRLTDGARMRAVELAGLARGSSDRRYGDGGSLP